MTNHPAQHLQEVPEPDRRRDVHVQIALNRHAVGLADDASTYGAMHAADWGRRGLLQRLHRRPPLRKVA